MIMNIKLQEQFKTSQEHYKKHVCANLSELEQKFNEVSNSKYNAELFYFGLTEQEYINEAKELSNEDFADATKTTTISGTIGFKGKPEEEWDDCFYIVRNPSKLINKNYFLEKVKNNTAIANMLWEAYVDHAKTDKFVDVCITKGNDEFANTSNKSILTFYPSDINKIERLKDSCLNYYDERGQVDQAKKDQFLVIIPTYYVKNNDLGLRGYVVKPTSISESKINRGHRGIDNMLSYKKGIYTDGNEIFTFNTEDETTRMKDKEGNHYALSSRNPTIAKKTFEKTACKHIFNTLEGRTSFRQNYIDNAICKWFSNYGELWNFLKNEPKIISLLKNRLGIDDSDDYTRYISKLNSLYTQLKLQWMKLEDD